MLVYLNLLTIDTSFLALILYLLLPDNYLVLIPEINIITSN